MEQIATSSRSPGAWQGLAPLQPLTNLQNGLVTLTQTQKQIDLKTHNIQGTDSIVCVDRHEEIKETDVNAISASSLFSISNTKTHMCVNGAMSRVTSGTLSSTTHGVHHFLSNSPFPIVNTHLCTIRRASGCLTLSLCLSLTHIYTHKLFYFPSHKYSSYKHTSA